MSSHLKIWKPSGRELITLSGQRVTVGQASTNLVSLKHDATVSRLHAVLENLGCAWSIRDVGSRNGTYLNGEKIAAERVLRSGDELRVGNSRLIFWEAKQADEASVYGTRRPGRDAGHVPFGVGHADAQKAGQSSSADNKLPSSPAISCSPRPRSLRSITRFRP